MSQRFDFQSYLVLEEGSPVKHEFLDGVVWAMAGGSPEHAAIAANVARLLGNQLVGQRCRVFSSDLRVRVKATGLATYPDVTVVCGQLELDPDDPKGHTVINPKLLVEILSPSTAEYDRGEKLDHYRQIESLEVILLVAHDAHQIDVWRRTAAGWQHEAASEGSVVVVAPINAEVSVREVYSDPLR